MKQDARKNSLRRKKLKKRLEMRKYMAELTSKQAAGAETKPSQ